MYMVENMDLEILTRGMDFYYREILLVEKEFNVRH